jgi:hypothetical protein
MLIMIPCSFGELIDKLTILEIKRLKLKNTKSIEHVEFEWNQLHCILLSNPLKKEDQEWLEISQAQLFQVNLQLWDLEVKVRAFEKEQDFGPSFLACARAIYSGNDLRASLKLKINLKLGSEIVEVKSHAIPDS